MGIVYHGSKEHGLKRLEPRKSTHGVYVYATPEKVLALIFSGKCGDDLTYDIGHFDTEKNEPWELVEKVPCAFDKMFSNTSSIYSLNDDTFKDIHTGFCEVVSDVGVTVQSEEYCENVWSGLVKVEQEGLVKIYRYPNKPSSMKKDGSDILDKWRFYKTKMSKEFSKNDFDRLVYLHPELLNKINDLLQEFGYNYKYETKELVDIFRKSIERQLYDREHEQYIDCAYISICSSYKEIESQIKELYYSYLDAIESEKTNKL